MDQGKLAEVGTHEELMENRGSIWNFSRVRQNGMM